VAAAVTIGDNSRAELFHFVPVRQNGRLLMSLGDARELENLLKRQKGGVGLGKLKALHSPELNPVEPLGDIVKNGIANRLFTALSDLEAAILNELELWRRKAHLVRQLLGRYFTVSSANACGRC
jgi:hypothetical protein